MLKLSITYSLSIFLCSSSRLAVRLSSSLVKRCIKISNVLDYLSAPRGVRRGVAKLKRLKYETASQVRKMIAIYVLFAYEIKLLYSPCTVQ